MTLESPETRQALRRAAHWHLIGLLLERPREGWLDQIEALGKETESEILREGVTAARDATEGLYLRLFAEGGVLTPREASNRMREEPSQILADLASFYQAFAFEPKREEPIDHIAVECGFLGYLYLKEAHALFHGDEVNAQITAEAEQRFIADHMAPFAESLADRLAQTGVPHVLAAAHGMLEILAETLPPEEST